MHSCFYEGQVRHRRFAPRPHEFSYRLFYVYLDLDEVETVFNKRWLWSGKRPALAWFKRQDYLGETKVPLKQAVQQRIFETTNKQANGPIRVLTHLRYFGFIFNPVSFYYCYDQSDSFVEFIVAEITNTPWGERHSYVLCPNEHTDQASMQFNFAKDFHVSPFMAMDINYHWYFNQPQSDLNVHMENYSGEQKVFDATLNLQRKAMSAKNCAYLLSLYPMMTSKVILAIYWQALRLYLKRIPFFTHPKNFASTNNGGAKQAK